MPLVDHAFFFSAPGRPRALFIVLSLAALVDHAPAKVDIALATVLLLLGELLGNVFTGL